MVKAGYGQIAVGDLSSSSAATSPLHDTHEVGLDADIRPMRKANDQCSHGSNWRLAAYDRAATRALIMAIRAATPGHVKFILFNDPQLIREGLTVPGGPRRPPPRPLLRSEPPGSRLPLLRRVRRGRPRDGCYLIVRVPIIAPGWMVQ